MSLEKPLLLLVEEEALLAMPLEQELVDAGFEVVVVLNSTDALAELDRDAARFSGVITDIRLPGAQGWTVGRHARELVPTMPVVYMSGDSGADWAANGVPNSVMLNKPFVFAQLLTAISTLLNRVPLAG